MLAIISIALVLFLCECVCQYSIPLDPPCVYRLRCTRSYNVWLIIIILSPRNTPDITPLHLRCILSLPHAIFLVQHIIEGATFTTTLKGRLESKTEVPKSEVRKK